MKKTERDIQKSVKKKVDEVDKSLNEVKQEAKAAVETETKAEVKNDNTTEAKTEEIA